MAGILKTSILTVTLILGYVKAQEYTLNGNVQDELTFTNLPGVLVSTPTKSDTTDEFGDWEISDTVVDIKEENSQPKGYYLSQNYPNPFNPSTKISFTTPINTSIDFIVHSITGEEIIKSKKELPKGTSTINIEGLGAAGVYIYSINSGKFTDHKKMVLLDGSSGKPSITWNYGGQKTFIKKINKSLEQIPITFSKQGYEPDTIFVEQITQNLGTTLLEQKKYELNAIIELYNTRGQKILDLDSVQITWPDQTKEMIPNQEGKLNINKTLYTINQDTTAIITHKKSDLYLNWFIGTTINKEEIERLYQNENSEENAKIPLNKINNKTTEAYMVTKTVEYLLGTINMDHQEIISLFQRPQFPAISSHHPSPAGYDTTNILQLTWNLDTGEPIAQDQLDRALLQMTTYLDGTQLENQKKLLKYKIDTINSFDDSLAQLVFNPPRNGDNYTYTAFYNSITGNGVQIANDGTLRIKNSNSLYNTGSTSASMLSEIFSSMTNTTGQLSHYVSLTPSGGALSDLGKKLIGIAYLFKPGTQYKLVKKVSQ